MALTELNLTDTIGQMRDKINGIINIINGSQIKLEKSGDPSKYVILTYDGTDINITDQDGTDKGHITITSP